MAYTSHPGSSTANLNNARTTPSSAYWHPTVNLNYTRGLTAEQLYLQALASKEKSPQAGRAYLGNVRVTEELPLQEPRLSASSRYFLPTFGIITLTLTIFVLLASWWVTPRLLDFLCQTPDGRVPTSKAQSTVYLTSTSPLLDSGALGSHTIAPQDADLLKNLRPTNVLVEGALGAAEVDKTKGNLLLSHKGQSLSINDAIAVSSTKRTLISLPVLADEGKKVLFEGELAAVYPPGTVFTASIPPIFHFVRRNKEDGWTIPKRSVFQATAKPLSAKETLTMRALFQWHEDLDHLSFGLLRRLKPWGPALHVPTDLPDPYCRHCALKKLSAKKAAGTFRKSMSSDPLREHIFFDLSGKARVPSLYGESYFTLYKKATTGWLLVSFQVHKSDSLGDIQAKFKAFKKKSSGLSLVAVSDNAREYVQEKLKKWLKDNDIEQLTTPVGEAWQRGMVEVEMKIIKRTAKTSMHSSQLPEPFFFFAVDKAVWTRVLWPSTTRGFLTPFELEFGRPPSYDLCRPFGVACVVLYNNDRVEGIFVGIDMAFTPGGTFRVFVPERFGTSRHSSHILASPNVMFDRTAGSGMVLLRRLARDQRSYLSSGSSKSWATPFSL